MTPIDIVKQFIQALMNNYEEYEIEDFTCDDDFISWCIQPDEASDQFWREWLSSNPTQKAIALQAKELILDLHTIENEKNKLNIEQEIWGQIEANIGGEKNENVHTLPSLLQWGLGIAATIVFLWGISYLIPYKSPADSNTQLADLEWINYENNSGLSKSIFLEDGSTVVVEPFGTLKYPSSFSGDERAVFLEGEAFFDIARDTLQPFLVYANETITKVLGTSFRITAYEGEKTVEVDVKSGKVAVYAKVSSNEQFGDKKRIIVETDERISIPRPNKKLEVTPNQKVVFDKKRAEMIRTVTETPQVITQLEELPQFKFKNESVIKVFKAFEQIYGIDLEFDAELLEGCTITTQLEDEPLFQKLNIICTALELKFVERDAVIFIEGEGC